MPHTPSNFELEAMPHRDHLFAHALRLTRNPADAEDLVQDTWMRALGAWDRYVPGSNCKAWLLRILTNSFINGYRRGRRRRHVEQGARTDAVRGLYGTDRDTTAPAQLRLVDEQLGDEVSAALEGIGKDYRQVVELADLQGRRYKEIANDLGVPMGTVMSRLFRARRRLEEQLREFAANDYGIVRAA